jgi:hypothetical protein
MLLPGVTVYYYVVNIEFFMSKGITLYWYRPSGVTKADISLALLDKGTPLALQ